MDGAHRLPKSFPMFGQKARYPPLERGGAPHADRHLFAIDQRPEISGRVVVQRRFKSPQGSCFKYGNAVYAGRSMRGVHFLDMSFLTRGLGVGWG
jgi:hypothetical protein